MLQCCADDALDVRQSALALLGDLVKVLYLVGGFWPSCCLLFFVMSYKSLGSFLHLYFKWTIFVPTLTCGPKQARAIHLQPRLAEFLNVAAKQLVGVQI